MSLTPVEFRVKPYEIETLVDKYDHYSNVIHENMPVFSCDSSKSGQSQISYPTLWQWCGFYR